jgi:adhesin transport system membrane fusion protein
MNRLFEEENWNYYLLVIPIGLFFIVFLFWAGNNEVDEVVRGEGKVVPSGQTKVLQHLEGGIISKILVKEGDKVKRGDVIYQLSNALFKAELKANQQELDAYMVMSMRIQAEIDGLKKFEVPKRLLHSVPDIVANEKRSFYMNRQANEQKINIAKDQLKQKKLKYEELKIKHKNLKLEYKLSNQNMQILDKLLKKNVVSKKEYLKEQKDRQKTLTSLEETKNNLPVVYEEISEARNRLDGTISDNKTKLMDLYSKVQVKINKLLEKTKASQDRDVRTEVISPVNGIVNKLHFYTVGGVIKQGDKMAEVTPVEDSLMIEARIKTSDRATVWSGQKVMIEVTAYDSSKYGLVEGRLISISPDSSIDKQTRQTFYTVKVLANDFNFAPNSPILPGMVANINILTGKKTILQYILKPLKDISRNALTEK